MAEPKELIPMQTKALRFPLTTSETTLLLVPHIRTLIVGESRLVPLPADTSNVVVKNSGDDNNIYARPAVCRWIPEVVVPTALATTTSKPDGKLQTEVKCRRPKRTQDDDI